MRVLVTGSRTYSDKLCIANSLSILKVDDVLIHGDCSGADKLSGSIAENLSVKVEKYPDNWSSHGKAAGPIRNSTMVNTLPDIVMVFHESIDSLKASKGTRSCLMLLKKKDRV